MECKAKLLSVYENTAVIKILDADANMIPKDDDLKVKITPYKNKRSLNANAYFHVLVGKIAESVTISKAKAKNILICKYGQPVTFEDGNFLYYKTNAPIEFMQEQEEPHMSFIKMMPDGMYMYKQYRGSHTYNTAEMSYLINGTVADAKELKIETLTPTEIDRLKHDWSDYCEKHPNRL